MFNLVLSELESLKILDCPSGASSFVAEAFNDYDIKKVVGCDILYEDNVKALEKRGMEDIRYTMERMSHAYNLYNWDFYKSIDGLCHYRSLALKKFLLDYNKGYQKRYLKTKLPKLPFDDKSFDIILSANLLFYYDYRLDYSFHRESIFEFLRVGSEIRIFPIQRADATLSVFFERFIQEVKESESKISFRIEKV